MRRSNVLNIPLQLVFPGSAITNTTPTPRIGDGEVTQRKFLQYSMCNTQSSVV
jgi:hypothetical protein